MVKFTTWIEEVWEGDNSKLLRREFSFLARINKGSIGELDVLKLLYFGLGMGEGTQKDLSPDSVNPLTDFTAAWAVADPSEAFC